MIDRDELLQDIIRREGELMIDSHDYGHRAAMNCGNCGRPIREAAVAYTIRYTHQMTGYFCYKSGPEHAEPYLIEERP